MPELPLDAITLHYETAGEGPPLLLVPGMLSDNASWLPLVAHLEGHVSLVMPDPRGAGRTRPKAAPITLEALAQDMLEVMAHLGHARFAVAGHSLGGLVALAMAGAAPDRITRLAALATTPRPSARLPALFRTLLAIRRAPEGERLWVEALFPWLFHDRFFRDPQAVAAAVQASLDYPHAQDVAAMAHQVDALGRVNLKALPERLAMPGRAFLAAEDAMIAVDPARAAWKALGAEVEIVPKTAHSLHWDAPEDVATRLMAFLNA